jgi:hypothetical protein
MVGGQTNGIAFWRLNLSKKLYRLSAGKWRSSETGKCDSPAGTACDMSLGAQALQLEVWRGVRYKEQGKIQSYLIFEFIY